MYDLEQISLAHKKTDARVGWKDAAWCWSRKKRVTGVGCVHDDRTRKAKAWPIKKTAARVWWVFEKTLHDIWTRKKVTGVGRVIEETLHEPERKKVGTKNEWGREWPAEIGEWLHDAEMKRRATWSDVTVKNAVTSVWCVEAERGTMEESVCSCSERTDYKTKAWRAGNMNSVSSGS